jgi:putative DNA primase/helicase
MNNLSLDSDHYQDLQKSGLSDSTIKDAGIKSVPKDQINKKLGFNIDGLISMYEIPFDDNYSRYKVFYEQGKEFNKDGDKKPKYLARQGSGNRLYIPAAAKSILDDVNIPLELTEGEKKALKACQEGLHCIGIAGLWNWKVKGKDELIPDFDKVALDGRTIYFVPDNDWLKPNNKGKRKNLKQAVNSLACLLIDRGAKVFWRELPNGG